MKFFKNCLLVLIIFLGNNMLFSQVDTMDIYDLSLTQLSKLKITTATKMSQNINEISSTIYIITAAEIKEKGYFTLEEALSDLPGFQFRNTIGMNSYVFQRGIPNQNNLTLVLVDGVQINELNSGGFYGGGQYNLSNVERIEVIYGPASVMYGTNAVSGIINIITKSSSEKQFSMNMLGGNFNTTNGDFTYRTVNDTKTFGLAVSGMFKTSEKADLKGKEGDYNWTDLMDNFENDYAFDIKAHSKNFVFGTNYIFKQASTVTNNKSVGTNYKDVGTCWNIQFVNNYLKYFKNISEKLSLSAIFYNRNATVIKNSVFYVLDTTQVGYYRPNNLTGLENVLTYKANKIFSLTSGLTFEFDQLSQKASMTYSDTVTEKPPTPEHPVMLNNYLLSLFAEPRITLFNHLYISGGARFDQSSIYDQVLTPRVGINYLLKKHVFRISYDEAFRAPKPWDYTDGVGNSYLLPETMKSLEAACSFTLSDQCKIDFVGYKNNLKNTIIKEYLTGGYRWVNDGTLKTDGVEIFFRYSSNKLKTSINYTYTNSRDTIDAFTTEISMHSGNASITYTLRDYVKVSLRANYYGKRENPKYITTTSSNYIDPCLIFNGAISLIDYKNISVQFIIKNILNTEYYHTSNRDPERYRQPQRTIMLSVGYRIKED